MYFPDNQSIDANPLGMCKSGQANREKGKIKQFQSKIKIFRKTSSSSGALCCGCTKVFTTHFQE